jgi:hypothetical protein
MTGCPATCEIGLEAFNEKEQKEKFQEKMVKILNSGAVNLAIGIGYKLGVFDAKARFERIG